MSVFKCNHAICLSKHQDIQTEYATSDPVQVHVYFAWFSFFQAGFQLIEFHGRCFFINLY